MSSDNKESKPFNKSVFYLRDAYEEIFCSKNDNYSLFEVESIFDDVRTDKIFHVKYYINILPKLGIYVKNFNNKKIIVNKGKCFL